MRIFVGLDIPDQIRTAIARYTDGLRNFAPDVRWVRPESFHVTLKFIGEQKLEAVEQIKRELATAKATPFDIAFRGTGFFPSTKNPRVFWVGILALDALPKLAASVDEAVSRTGIPRETNPYKPHLTLARAGSGRPHPQPGDRPNNKLARLADKLEALPQPDFGTMTAREFFLYESKLSPSGARYFKLQAFPLEQSSVFSRRSSGPRLSPDD
jgi:RNA 2',3'-cyclic 3'-phosphodiesterase